MTLRQRGAAGLLGAGVFTEAAAGRVNLLMRRFLADETTRRIAS
jgi:hypothetical protein